jgi:tetratricopeptide (TPR) repeat protein
MGWEWNKKVPRNEDMNPGLTPSQRAVGMALTAGLIASICSCGGGNPERSATFRDLMKRGEMEFSKENYRGAEKLFREAFAHGISTGNNLEVTDATLRLVQSNERLNHPAASEDVLKQALEFAGKHNLTGEPLYRKLLDLAGHYEDQGQYAGAEPILQRAVDLWVKSYGDGDKALAGVPKIVGKANARTDKLFQRLAKVLEAQGKFAEAEPLRRKTLEIQQRERAMDVASVMDDLADNLVEQGRYDEAGPLYDKALAMRLEDFNRTENIRKIYGDLYLESARNRAAWRELSALAEMHRRQGHHLEAESLFTKALDAGSENYNPGVPDRREMQVKLNYARLLRATGRADEAKQLEESVRRNEETLRQRNSR